MPKKRHRITRREMREDSLVTFSLKAADFVKRNARVLAIVALIAAASIIVVFMMTRDRAKAESEAEVLLAQANKELWRGNSPEAVSLYDELLDRYAGTKSGKKGLLFKGDALLDAGKYDEAMDSYEKFLAKERKDELLRSSAKKGIATVLEDKGEFAKAAEVHTALGLKLEGNDAAQELMSAARCYTAASMYGQAIELYEKVISRHPDYWGVEQAKVYLEELRTKLKLAGLSSSPEGKGAVPQSTK
ncbi:MAG: tetratricopeptide repeat protein [Candidatus Eisenbacteria bacterium]|nr:tetratricopeptide repeat protein [Candidatus Eisenbacteria bacterium]